MIQKIERIGYNIGTFCFLLLDFFVSEKWERGKNKPAVIGE
jgi:hypothetical protein